MYCVPLARKQERDDTQLQPLITLTHPVVYCEPLARKKNEGAAVSSDSLLGGGYLLSHFRSTIGVVRLNFSVRNGKRWDPHAITTLLPSSPYGAYCMRRGCVDKKKKPSGERCARKPVCRDLNSSRYSSYFYRARPLCLYLFPLPAPHAPQGDRARFAPRKLSGD